MQRLLLRQRLHLNLNLNLDVTETLQDGVDIDDVDEDIGDEEFDEDDSNTTIIVADIIDAQGSGHRYVGDYLQTVTTVPQTKQQQQLRHKITATTAAATTAATTTTSSSTASSALAKFNRILDAAKLEPHRASSAFSSATLQQRLALAYPEQQQQQQQQELQEQQQINNLPRSNSRGIAVVSTPLTLQALNTIKLKTAAMQQKQIQQQQQQQQHDAAEQTKRNDVHYLLKQLNSFSDIEEIDIVDMKQRQQRQQQHQQHPQEQQQQQQQQQRTTAACSSSLELMPMSNSMAPIAMGSPSTQSHKGNFMAESQDSSNRLQFDDYLFESCHYLETNYFAATYRTAMVESSSHEFRPSTTTPTSTRSDSFELHELEPPSVICKAAPPPPPPYQHQHQAEARMTHSGVQTELTVDSLAQLSNGSSGASSGGSPRVPPLFICCYTPLDRWRARRRLGAAAAAKRANSEKNGHAV